MSDDLAVTPTVAPAELEVIRDPTAAEQALAVMTKGDLSMLKPDERAQFLVNIAKSLGLNPLTRPIDLIKNDKGQLITYYNKGATDQLRALHRVNLEVIDKSQPTPNTYAVTVRATLPNGRQDEDMGVVIFNQQLSPAEQANAPMKAITKAKRRVTLSILGLAMLDESEMDTIPAFRAQLEAQQNAPRRLQAPPGAQAVVQVVPSPSQEQIVAPSATQEVVEATVTSAPTVAPKPQAAAPVAPLPAAQVMKRRLPAAPPIKL